MTPETVAYALQFTPETLALDHGTAFEAGGWHGTHYWMCKGPMPGRLSESGTVRWADVKTVDGLLDGRRRFETHAVDGCPYVTIGAETHDHGLFLAADVLGAEEMRVNATFAAYIEHRAEFTGRWVLVPGFGARGQLAYVVAFTVAGIVAPVLKVDGEWAV